MPILDVELVGPLRKRLARGLAARPAAAGAALDAPPTTAWVLVRCLVATGS